jgi:hypothetical protein
MMTLRQIINAAKPPASYLNPGDMERVGVANITGTAKAFNRLRWGSIQRKRVENYRSHFDELLREHGAPSAPPNVIRDGWALDTSLKLPHLDRVLKEGADYIEKFCFQARGNPNREFIRDIFRQDQIQNYPSFLDFITSADVLGTVAGYLGFIPVLSTTAPPGIRLTESCADGQKPGGYRNSQFYHLDLHDSPLVYVIVLLRDTTMASGPFTFLPASVSERAAHALNYKKRKVRYHVPDETMYGIVERAEARVMTYPAGTVLFIDSSRCFHFGSRDAAVPRYQLMYAFVSACRTDFTELYIPLRVFPVRETDSRLKKMVLQKHYNG